MKKIKSWAPNYTAEDSLFDNEKDFKRNYYSVVGILGIFTYLILISFTPSTSLFTFALLLLGIVFVYHMFEGLLLGVRSFGLWLGIIAGMLLTTLNLMVCLMIIVDAVGT